MKKGDSKRGGGFLPALPYVILALILAAIVVVAINI